jgi:hypothetical protein
MGFVSGLNNGVLALLYGVFRRLTTWPCMQGGISFLVIACVVSV